MKGKPTNAAPSVAWSALGDLLSGYQGWMALGLCQETDPEIYFPQKGGPPHQAKLICAACEVQAQCLDYALANRESHGIFGGLSRRERRALRESAESGPALPDAA